MYDNHSMRIQWKKGDLQLKIQEKDLVNLKTTTSYLIICM